MQWSLLPYDGQQIARSVEHLLLSVKHYCWSQLADTQRAGAGRRTSTMDALPYVDTLFKEYLLFRGFTTTLEMFNKDLANDPGCGFQAERITELIFRKLIPKLDFQQLVEFLEFLNMGLYSRLDSRYESLVSTVEADLLRLYLVTAHSAKRTDKIAEFFKVYGPQLLSNSSSNSSSSSYRSGTGSEGCTDWREWFLLPYLQHPEREQRFQVYFTSEWSALLEISFRNFLSGVMRCLPLPAVLRFNTDRRLRLALQQQVHVLQDELDRCRKQLEAITAHHEQQQQQAAQQQQDIQQQNVQQQQNAHEPQQAARCGPQQQPQHHQESVPLQTPAPAAAAAAAAAAEEQIPHRIVHGLHRRDLSLDNWQHRKSGPGTSRLQPGRRSSTGSAEAAVDHDQKLHVLQLDHPRFQIRSPDLDQHDHDHDHDRDHTRSEIRSEGSGLFDLLPATTQPPQRSSAAGNAAAAAAAKEDDQQQQPAFAVVHRAISGSPGHQRRHSRTSSLSGAISFEPSPAEQQQPEDGDLAAAAAAAGAASTPSQQQQRAGGLSTALAAAAGISPAALSLDLSNTTVPAAPAAAAATPGSSTAPSPQSSRRSSSSAAAAAAVLSTSPVMSWASGMQVSSSAAGLRSRHSSHASNAGGSSSSTLAAAWDDKAVTSPGSDLPSAAVVPLVLLPVEPSCHVSITEISPAGTNPSNPSSSSSSSSITCVAFSSSGSNVATAYADGGITIWTLPSVQGYSAVQGNAARRASFACGAPVTSLSWDTRADKHMLIGCAAGGGVRAWHADTKRIMSDVGPEPGFPHVVAVAACPVEPFFAVAANSAVLALAGHIEGFPELIGPTGSAPNTTGSSGSSVSGRLVLYNSRSFKRSAVLSVPGDMALVSLAYSSSGSQLVAGTAAGTALLFEPASRNMPIRVWHVAAAVSINNSSSSSGGSLAYQPVQVAWCPDPAGQVIPAAAGGGSSSSSSPGSSQPAAGVSGSGSVLTLCGGVLCKWAVGSSSQAPVTAVDVIAAAAAAVRGVDPGQQQQLQQDLPDQQGQAPHDQHEQGYASGDYSSSAATKQNRSMWSCSLAVSADGKSCAVLCATASAGALLMYTLAPSSGDAVGMSAPPQILVSGSSLAGGGSLSWHPSSTPLVIACARRVAGHLMVRLSN